MTTRPILFSGEMVRAILDGRKSQTRRVVKHPARASASEFDDAMRKAREMGWPGAQKRGPCDGIEWACRCPYGAPGGLLYVKEAFRVAPESHPPDGHYWCEWLADGVRWEMDYSEVEEQRVKPGRVRTGRFMPRWASRITLEVTGVRVERVQEITPEDAAAEGCGTVLVRDGERVANLIAISDEAKSAQVDRFRALWDSINAARGYGWDVNPWVFVVEFERVSP